MCQRCLQKPVKPGNKLCQSCLQKIVEERKQRDQKRKAFRHQKVDHHGIRLPDDDR